MRKEKVVLEQAEKIARLRRAVRGDKRLEGTVDWLEQRAWPVPDRWFRESTSEQFDRPYIRAAVEGITEAREDIAHSTK